MPDNVQTESPPSVASLVGGIIEDAQRLVRQELRLARRELQTEWDKTKIAALAILVGLAVCGLAGVFLGSMLVYVLHELAGVPLYGAYGIVGVLLGIVGGILFYGGSKKAGEVHLVPPQTAETLRENVQWMQNPR
jgi:protein-S-isoprenylcysteine O-methyltransferase Ste14